MPHDEHSLLSVSLTTRTHDINPHHSFADLAGHVGRMSDDRQGSARAKVACRSCVVTHLELRRAGRLSEFAESGAPRLEVHGDTSACKHAWFAAATETFRSVVL